MTLIEKIDNLTWYNNIVKPKEVLKSLSASSTPVDSRPYKVFTGVLNIDRYDGVSLIAKEDTITGLTVNKISNNRFDISFVNQTDIENSWVAPMVFQALNTSLSSTPGSFGISNYFIPLFATFNTNYGGLGGETNVLRIVLPSDYVYPGTFGNGASANIEIRVYN